MLWTKQDRMKLWEGTGVSYGRRKDVLDHVDDLIDMWHAQAPDDVSLNDFLGLTREEWNIFASTGAIPDRIQVLWNEGNY